MLLRVALLVLCVLLLVVCIRFCEWLSWLEAERLPLQLVDPLALSIRQLKELLEARGIPHDDLVEKSALVEAVEDSGGLSTEESEVLLHSASFQDSLNFTSESHFLEEVEDSKSAVWVVRVVPHGHKPFPQYPLWNVLAKRLSRIGIQTGTFYCPRHNTWCLKQGWRIVPAMILTMPSKYDSRPRIEVYQGVGTERSMISWLYAKLEESVTKIRDVDGLEKWETEEPVRVLQHTESTRCNMKHIIPAFISALAVQFIGKVSFSVMDTSDECKTKSLRGRFDRTRSTIMIKTPEFTHVYGTRKGEQFQHQALRLFLTTLTPTTNDLFILALMFINYSCLFEIFLSNGNLARRIFRTLWFMAKRNFLLCSVWLPLVSVFQISQVKPLLAVFMSHYRRLMNTELAAVLRHDALILSRYPALVLSIILISIVLLSYLDRKYRLGLVARHQDLQLPFLDFMPTVEHLVHFDPITWPLYTTRVSELPDEKWLQRCVSELMSGLSTWEWGEGEERGGGVEECAICLDLFGGGACVSSLPCSHTFHTSCTETWMTSGCENRWRCPMCREPII